MHVISVQGFTVAFPLKLNAPTTSSLRWQRSRFLMANEAAIKTSCPQRHKEIETQKQRQRGLRIQLAVDRLLACKLRHSNEQEFWSRSWQQAWGIHSAVQNVWWWSRHNNKATTAIVLQITNCLFCCYYLPPPHPACRKKQKQAQTNISSCFFWTCINCNKIFCLDCLPPREKWGSVLTEGPQEGSRWPCTLRVRVRLRV